MNDRVNRLIVPTLLFVVLSCSGGLTISPEEQRVKELEAELTGMSNGYSLSAVDSTRRELIHALDDLYRAGISDSLSAQSLDKMHLTYSAMHDYVNAARIADTLLIRFPDYPNRELVLESQANNYDVFILPRDKEKVKYYLELLLKEFPNMPAERKEGFEYRLQHVHLTMEEMIELQSGEIQ